MDNREFFSTATTIGINRSKDHYSYKNKGTCNTGRLIPLGTPTLVIPGSTFKFNTSFVIRGNTPIADTMDDAFADIFFFSVPLRLVWSHWENMFGQNDSSAWTESQSYSVPTIPSSLLGDDHAVQTLLNYLGVPHFYDNGSGSDPSKSFGVDLADSINCLPVRGYYLIWNEFFRDQNTQSPVVFGIDDKFTLSGTFPGTSFPVELGHGYDVMPVNRYHGYFGSCLPAPQKGPSVSLPLGSTAPLVSTGITGLPSTPTTSVTSPAYLGLSTNGAFNRLSTGSATPYTVSDGVKLSGIEADLSAATAATINELRTSIAIQHVYESLARHGSRYVEYLSAEFGVHLPDSVDQRPQFLGGVTRRIHSDQVVNTTANSSSGGQGALGQVGSYSLTSGSFDSFTHSFKEWSLIFPLMCIRTNQSFSQGLPRLYSKLGVWDYFRPALAHLGEQAVMTREIFATDDNSVPGSNDVFGYQERWAEHRYHPDEVAGYLDPSVSQSISYWTYCNNFATSPTLAGFLPEVADNVDRTIQVTSKAAGFQWIYDFFFDVDLVSPLPLHCDPGLSRI